MDATLRAGMSRAKVPIVGPEGSGAERNALHTHSGCERCNVQSEKKKSACRGRMKKKETIRRTHQSIATASRRRPRSRAPPTMTNRNHAKRNPDVV